MKFRRKPIVVEAIKFEYTKDGVARLRNFAGENVELITKAKHAGAIAEAYFVDSGINHTVRHIAYEGDWIVKDANGEFLPVKPDVFHKEFKPIPDKKEK